MDPTEMDSMILDPSVRDQFVSSIVDLVEHALPYVLAELPIDERTSMGQIPLNEFTMRRLRKETQHKLYARYEARAKLARQVSNLRRELYGAPVLADAAMEDGFRAPGDAGEVEIIQRSQSDNRESTLIEVLNGLFRSVSPKTDQMLAGRADESLLASVGGTRTPATSFAFSSQLGDGEFDSGPEDLRLYPFRNLPADVPVIGQELELPRAFWEDDESPKELPHPRAGLGPEDDDEQ